MSRSLSRSLLFLSIFRIYYCSISGFWCYN